MAGGSHGRNWNGWYGGGHGSVSSVAAAVRLADRWLAHARSGERVDPDVGGMAHFPGYYTLDTTRNGKTVGMLSVNARTGTVWHHGWHGPLPRRAGVLAMAWHTGAGRAARNEHRGRSGRHPQTLRAG